MMASELAEKTQLNRPDIDQDKEIDKGIKASQYLFELIDKYFDSFVVNFLVTSHTYSALLFIN